MCASRARSCPSPPFQSAHCDGSRSSDNCEMAARWLAMACSSCRLASAGGSSRYSSRSTLSADRCPASGPHAAGPGAALGSPCAISSASRQHASAIAFASARESAPLHSGRSSASARSVRARPAGSDSRDRPASATRSARIASSTFCDRPPRRRLAYSAARLWCALAQSTGYRSPLPSTSISSRDKASARARLSSRSPTGATLRTLA